MKRRIVIALLSGTLCSPAVAQDPHAGHTTTPGQPSALPVTPTDPHPSHDMPAAPPSPAPETADPHAGHTMPMPADSEHAEHTTPAGDESMGDSGTETAQPVGNAPPPAVIRDSAADRYYGAAEMSRARDVLVDEHGGALNSKVMANILEYTEADESSGYRWDLEAWYGGDINRFVFKTEGEKAEDDGVQVAETQVLYSRAVGRYTDVQAGIRHDFEPDSRTYATVAVESLLPYWFEVEASLFLSDRGDFFGRLEGSYDLRLTQRLILQPRLELELAAQNVAEANIGSGISSAELGLRLRFDIRKEFAPYIGVNFEESFGQTAQFARANGEDERETSIVVGLRALF
jgi:copper resistance protein B